MLGYYTVTYPPARVDPSPVIPPLTWDFATRPSTDRPVQRRMAVPDAVSSTVQPSATSSSRRASARAKSLACRASSRAATNWAAASSISPDSCPEGHAEHRHQHGRRARERRRALVVAGIGRRVRRGHQLEDAGQRARGVEVVVHARSERGHRRLVETRRRLDALDDEALGRLLEQPADPEASGEAVEAVQRLLGVDQRLGGDLDGRAVVRPQARGCDRPGRRGAPGDRAAW